MIESPRSLRLLLALSWCLFFAVASAHAADPPKPVLNSAPSAQDWADLARLPDWSGVWVPDREHPNFKFGSVSAPWTPAAAAYLAEQVDLVKAGKPNNIYINCLPEGMPSLVIMARSASEFLFTPGRLTISAKTTASAFAASTSTGGTPGRSRPDVQRPFDRPLARRYLGRRYRGHPSSGLPATRPSR